MTGNAASKYYYDIPNGTNTVVAYKDVDLKVRDDAQTAFIESLPVTQKQKAIETINAVKNESSSFFSGKSLEDGYHSSLAYTQLLNSSAGKNAGIVDYTLMKQGIDTAKTNPAIQIDQLFRAATSDPVVGSSFAQDLVDTTNSLIKSKASPEVIKAATWMAKSASDINAGRTITPRPAGVTLAHMQEVFNAYKPSPDVFARTSELLGSMLKFPQMKEVFSVNTKIPLSQNIQAYMAMSGKNISEQDAKMLANKFDSMMQEDGAIISKKDTGRRNEAFADWVKKTGGKRTVASKGNLDFISQYFIEKDLKNIFGTTKKEDLARAFKIVAEELIDIDKKTLAMFPEYADSYFTSIFQRKSLTDIVKIFDTINPGEGTRIAETLSKSSSDEALKRYMFKKNREITEMRSTIQKDVPAHTGVKSEMVSDIIEGSAKNSGELNVKASVDAE